MNIIRPSKTISKSKTNAREYEQGFIAGQMGLTPDPNWSASHKAGFQAAHDGAHPIFLNLAGVPAILRTMA